MDGTNRIKCPKWFKENINLYKVWYYWFSKVTEEEGKKLADEFGMNFFETSAKTGYNVNEAFNYLIHEITKKIWISQKSKLKKQKRNI